MKGFNINMGGFVVTPGVAGASAAGTAPVSTPRRRLQACCALPRRSRAHQNAGLVLRMALAAAVSIVLASCAGLPRTAFSEQEQSIAQIPGMPDVRFTADAPAGEISRALGKDTIRAAAEKNGRFEMLALSGGAWDGAYGAGILNGWTRSGKRPKFAVVTGVSAGSLIAPFAFLGPEYDAELKDAFTSGVIEPVGDGTDSLLSVI